jgi:anti-anti-sigma regulatory factor
MSLTTRSSSSPAEHRSAVPGTFRVLGDNGSLVWSEPVFRIHGFEPGDVVPSTALMLAHCHRDDRPALEAVLRVAPEPAAEGRSVRYRLLDAVGTERIVLAVLAPGVDPRHSGRPADGVPHRAATDGAPAGSEGVLQDGRTGQDGHAGQDGHPDHDGHPGHAGGTGGRADGHAAQLLGLLVDLGAEIGATAARRADDMLAAAIASREVIDQAKGAAMLAYGLDGPAAFEFLRWHSEHLNVKVRGVAELASLADVPAPSPDPVAPADRDGLPARLVVRHALEGRTVLVRLDGEVDAATAPTLVAGLADALRATPNRGQLVVDAADLDRLGPVAALHIARLRRRCDHAGVTLRLVPPDGRPEMRGGAARSSM